MLSCAMLYNWEEWEKVRGWNKFSFEHDWQDAVSLFSMYDAD